MFPFRQQYIVCTYKNYCSHPAELRRDHVQITSKYRSLSLSALTFSGGRQKANKPVPECIKGNKMRLTGVHSHTLYLYVWFFFVGFETQG